MTLEEFEKVMEEKRKALLALKRSEERKVEIDKDLQAMQLLCTKKGNDEVFIKLVCYPIIMPCSPCFFNSLEMCG
jgi:plasminogen activator inhibitor 1 RNA-binding protein